MTANNTQTQLHILNIGYQLFAQKGFSNVGLTEILNMAGIPKGSFYHYFKSKELFGEAVINHYFEQYFQQLLALFENNNLDAYQQLMAYWQQWLDTQTSSCANNKCLVVKLTAEVADLSDTMRTALLNGTQQVVKLIANAIEKAINAKLITQVDTHLTANILYDLWLGASLQSKLHQNKQPLQQAMAATKNILSMTKQ